jgi:uncharacterized protein YyaL (SSP411 family)
MEAVQAATGHGGWPMTVFLTPDAEPFYFGTYFPPEARHGSPSFQQVLEGVVAAWADRRDEVAEVAGRIVADLAGRSLVHGGDGVPGGQETGQALLGLTREYDEQHGGFGGAGEDSRGYDGGKSPNGPAPTGKRPRCWIGSRRPR